MSSQGTPGRSATRGRSPPSVEPFECHGDDADGGDGDDARAELDRLHATNPAELDATERGARFGQAVIRCS
jgi:hypothetical protein